MDHSAVDDAPTVINTPGWEAGAAAIRVMKLLRPMDVVKERWLFRRNEGSYGFVRRGRRNDGGYVMVDDGVRDGIAYSFGISDDVSWDIDMAALGFEIYQYDHTVSKPPAHDPRFHFFQHGIAHENSPDGVFLSIPEIMARAGHNERDDIVLKMDIEGAEWAVFSSLSRGILNRFSQIVVELHRLTQIGNAETAREVVGVLERLNRSHQCVHVHANNWGWIGLLGGVLLPDTLEVSYVRRAGHRFIPTDRVFPTKLDMPCNPGTPDYFLGALGRSFG